MFPVIQYYLAKEEYSIDRVAVVIVVVGVIIT